MPYFVLQTVFKDLKLSVSQLKVTEFKFLKYSIVETIFLPNESSATSTYENRSTTVITTTTTEKNDFQTK